MKRTRQIIAWILTVAIMSMSLGVIPASALEQTASDGYPVGISAVTTGGNPLQDATITCSSEDADHIANGEQTGPAKYLVDGDKKTRWRTQRDWFPDYYLGNRLCQRLFHFRF